MMQYFPPEITIGAFSLIGILTGYIWNNQGKRIDRLFKTQEKRPCNVVCSQIGEIKNDIDWIKKTLEKKQW